MACDGVLWPGRALILWMLCWPLNWTWPGMEYCRPLVNIDQTPHHSSLYEYFSRHSRGSGSGSSPLRWRRKDIGEKILEEDLGVFNTLPKYTLAGTGGGGVDATPPVFFFSGISFLFTGLMSPFFLYISIFPPYFLRPPENFKTLTP